MRKTDAFRRAAALMAALSITVSLAAPAFAGTYYIDYGDITITKMDDGSQKIEQNGAQVGMDAAGDETIITTRDQTPATQESDLEGPAAEDSGFGPVVEDNYQPAQPEDAEEPKDDDQPEDDDQKNAEESENDEEQKDADRQENTDRKESDEAQKDADQPENTDRQENAEQQAQPQQAAPAAAPAASTPKNDKGNGFWGNTITVINNFADKVLNLTLRDVKIDVSDEDEKTALSVQGDGNVEIELDGDNELKSGFVRAGLEKNTSEGTLTLKDDNKDGSLKATGGANGAGIGGSMNNGTNKITIKGGTVEAKGGLYAAGIGGGIIGSGENITITGGEVKATGGANGAGIGGDGGSGGSNVTVSGAAQVTATAGKGSRYAGAGATIGGGGSSTQDSDGNTVPTPGTEIQADIKGLTTGYIHHIIYNPDLDLDGKPDGILKEWWEFARPKPNPEDPNAPAEETNEVSLGTPLLHVETLEGDPLPFNARQQGSTLRVTSDTLSARLHGTRQALEALREQGVEQIQFVTTLKTTTLSVEDLLTEGGSWFALEHDGLASRRLSAAQAESLKCRMR